MAAPLRRSTRIDGSAGGEPLSCGNQSTYNRVANAGNLHRLSPFQMPFGILHNLTGKSSLTFSIEKCHFITVIDVFQDDNLRSFSIFFLGHEPIDRRLPLSDRLSAAIMLTSFL